MSSFIEFVAMAGKIWTPSKLLKEKREQMPILELNMAGRNDSVSTCSRGESGLEDILRSNIVHLTVSPYSVKYTEISL